MTNKYEDNIAHLNRTIDDLSSDLTKANQAIANYAFALAIIPDPPVGVGETFSAVEKCTFAESRLAKMAAIIKANSFHCSECDALKFGKPSHIHQAAGDEVESFVCVDCVEQIHRDTMNALMGGE